MKKGKYIIGQGKDFKIANPLPSNGIGYDNDLSGWRWYVVDSTTRKIVGSYDESRTEFHKNKTTPTGCESLCKTCRKQSR